MASMAQDRIQKIKARAERVGLTIPQLCQAADVDVSTVYRWLEGRGARMDTFEVNVPRLEAELEKAELALLRYLLTLPHLRKLSAAELRARGAGVSDEQIASGGKGRGGNRGN